MEVIVRPVKEHRFVVVFRGEGLSDTLADTDPQATGERPLAVKGIGPGAERTVELVNKFVDQARAVLKEEKPANMILLRGFALPPKLPVFPELLRLRAVAITCYPMYRGLAKLVGMEALPFCADLDDELRVLSRNYDQYDFFYVHFKGTDRAARTATLTRRLPRWKSWIDEFPIFLRFTLMSLS